MSLPVRERGLKLPDNVYTSQEVRSLPVRERGLKLFLCLIFSILPGVAPRAGAWIEADS